MDKLKQYNGNEIKYEWFMDKLIQWNKNENTAQINLFDASLI